MVVKTTIAASLLAVLSAAPLAAPLTSDATLALRLGVVEAELGGREFARMGFSTQCALDGCPVFELQLREDDQVRFRMYV